MYNALADYEEQQRAEEEMYYYSIIRDCVEIINSYGMHIVMKDIIKQLTTEEMNKYATVKS